MIKHPVGFMSYVRFDDEHDNGRLTELCKRLSGEVRMHTGEDFDIFQDRNEIAWGQQWQKRIDESLDAVTFLIPIITPGFFKSQPCRDELNRFMDREKQLGRNDLILPVYYVDCPLLKNEGTRKADSLADIVSSRQYADWRELRFEPFNSPQMGKMLAKMARQVVEALERGDRPQSSVTLPAHRSASGVIENSSIPQNPRLRRVRNRAEKLNNTVDKTAHGKQVASDQPRNLSNELLVTMSGGREITARPYGTPFLPPDGTIDMIGAMTCFPGIYSVSREMRNTLETILNAVREDNHSLILVASGGSGKLEIARHVLATARQKGLDACWFDDLGIEWSWHSPTKMVKDIAKACAHQSFAKPFVAVDEVLNKTGARQLDVAKGIVELLDRANESNIRLLLIDANFATLIPDHLRLQLAGRVSWHLLPSPWDRPHDIPYVFASFLREATKGRDVHFSIEKSALIAIIEWMLLGRQHYGHLSMLAWEIVNSQGESKTIDLKWESLRKDVRGKYQPLGSSGTGTYIPKFE